MRKEIWELLGTTPAAPQGNGCVWKKQWEMSDEFERGRKTSWLRKYRWHLIPAHWKGRAPSFFLKSNVVVSNGSLKLYAREQDPPKSYPARYKDFSTAYVATKKKQKYGYFEILCKPMNSQLVSGFWLTQQDQSTWTAIDIFRFSTAGKNKGQEKNERVFHTNAIVLRHPQVKQSVSDVKEHEKPKNDKDKAIGLVEDLEIPGHLMTIGLDWNKSELVWYCNGEVIRREPNYHFHQEMQLVLDVEAMPNTFSLPPKSTCHGASLPDKFEVFWLRSWTR